MPEIAVRSENTAVDHTSVIATPSLAVVPAAPTHRLNGRRARVLALATLSAAALLMALLIPVGTHDWPYLAEGARLLWSREWAHVYALRPDVQVGPLALLLALLIDSVAATHGANVGLVLGALAYGPVLSLALRTAHAVPTPRRLLLVGLVGLLPWTALAGSGHLDEMLTLVLLLLAARAGASRRPALSGVLIGLATVAKPWAFTTLPAAFGSERRHSALTALVGLAVSLLFWAPFTAGIYQALHSGYPVAYPVRPGSIWEPWQTTSGLLGSWIRVPQLLAAFAACAAAARRGPVVALTVAFCVRIALDPGQWSYQFAVLAVLAVTLDVASPTPSSESLLKSVLRSAPLSLLVLAAMLLAWPSWVACATTLGLLLVVMLRQAPDQVAATPAGPFGVAGSQDGR